MNKRNYSVDIYKLYFAFVIAFGHFGTSIFHSGIVVNCFFIVSGYFLINSFNSNKYSSSFEYTKNKLSKIYPYYLFAFFSLLLVHLLTNLKNNLPITELIKNALPEIFLIQSIGIYDVGLNNPLWQFSSLLFASYILYGLLSYKKNLTQMVICPLTAVVLCSYFFNAFKTTDVEMWEIISFGWSATLLRAFAGLSIGIALYDLINQAVSWLQNKSFIFNTLITAISVFLFFWLKDTKSLIAFIIMFICALSNKGLLSILFNHKSFSYCEKLSLSIYLNHILVIRLINTRFIMSLKFSKNIIFLLVLIFISIIFERIVTLFLEKYRKKKTSTTNI